MISQQRQQKTTLYNIVFLSYQAKLAVMLLLLSFALQPIVPVYANEVVEDSPSENNVEEPEAQPEQNDETEVNEPDDITDEPVTEEGQAGQEELVETLDTEEVSQNVSEEQADEAIEEDEDTDAEEITTDGAQGSGGGSTNDESDDVDIDTEFEPNNDSSIDMESAVTDDVELIDEEVDAVIDDQDELIVEVVEATSTETTELVAVVFNDDNHYQFAKNACKPVGDGTYYCAETTAPSVVYENSVYATPDQSGDMEIFLDVDGDTVQITDNTFDDNAPYYDAVSKRVVWQSLREDRYQIMSYDIETEKTVQLTETTYNNMQPSALNGTTFWQAWIGNNWEIMLHEDGVTTQVTNNTVHDIAPYADEGYMLWQTQEKDQWQVSVYNIATKQQEYIDVDGDGMVKNPRFVLMYESHDENGDVSMFGYDLNTKENIALTNTQDRVPKKLPEPEHEEEKRALVNAKPTVKEDGEDTSDGDGNTDENDTVASSTISSSTDLVVEKPQTIATTSENSIPINSPEGIEDLVIPPLASTTDQIVR